MTIAHSGDPGQERSVARGGTQKERGLALDSGGVGVAAAKTMSTASGAGAIQGGTVPGGRNSAMTVPAEGRDCEEPEERADEAGGRPVEAVEAAREPPQ